MVLDSSIMIEYTFWFYLSYFPFRQELLSNQENRQSLLVDCRSLGSSTNWSNQHHIQLGWIRSKKVIWRNNKTHKTNQDIDFWLLISSALKSEQETEVITRKTRFVIGCIFKMADLVLNSHWSIALANQDTLHCLPLVRKFRWHYVLFKFWLQNPVLLDYARLNLWKMIQENILFLGMFVTKGLKR